MKIQSLPPIPKIKIDSESLNLLNEIDKKLARIDGCCLMDSDGFTIDLLKIREGLSSVAIDYPIDTITELSKIYQSASTSQALLIDYKNSIILGEKLIKNSSAITHALESIHKELLKGKNPSAGFPAPYSQLLFFLPKLFYLRYGLSIRFWGKTTHHRADFILSYYFFAVSHSRIDDHG